MGFHPDTCLICNLLNCKHTWEEKEAQRQDEMAKVPKHKHEWDIFRIRSTGKATTYCQVSGCWADLKIRPIDELINAIEGLEMDTVLKAVEKLRV